MASRGVNKVILVGNLGQDPEVRYTGDANNGAKVATIRLATTERYRDRSGNLQEHTEWHSVTLWRGLADVADKYVRKGSQLYIEGSLRTREWTDKDNQKHYSTEIQCSDMKLLGRRPDGAAPAAVQGGVSQASVSAPAQASAPTPAPTPVESADDLPF